MGPGKAILEDPKNTYLQTMKKILRFRVKEMIFGVSDLHCIL
jgi:hypothetical protein